MKRAKQEEDRQVQSAETAASVRASVSFPSELYRTLEEIAIQN